MPGTYGLDPITVPESSREVEPNLPVRGQKQTGALVTGQALQTDVVDPRFVIDSSQMRASRSDGSTAFKVDIATSTTTLLADAPGTGRIVFINTAGTEAGSIEAGTGGVQIKSVTFAGFNADTGTGKTALVSCDTSAPIVTIWALGSGSAKLTLRGVLTTEQMDVTTGPTNDVIRIQNGNLILIPTLAERNLMNAFAAFTMTIGMKFNTTVAAQAGGIFAQYRMIRGNAVGTAVTPSSATLSGSPIVNTNANTQAISVIRTEGCRLTYQSTATGAADYVNTVAFT